MAYLVDTNILVRTIDLPHAMHQGVMAALRKLIGAGEDLCLAPQNIIEFWNTSTRPVDRNGLGLSPREADVETARLEALFTLLPDHALVYPEWRRLVVAYGVSGVQVHDARLVAVMNVYAVPNLLTMNGRDFARYPNMRCIQPRDL